MRNQILALFLALPVAVVLADELPCPFLEGGKVQTVDRQGRNVTLFAAGYYERPNGPPETEGAKWIPGRKRNLCSVSTFSRLSDEESEGGDGGGNGDKDGGDDGNAEDGGQDENEKESENGDLASMNDCLVLHDWASSHPGHWVIPQRNLPLAPVLVLGSCTITVSVRREWRGRLPWGVAISSEDVKRVVREVLEKFVEGGRVGGRGGMGCLGWGKWEAVAVPVDWRVGGWAEGV